MYVSFIYKPALQKHMQTSRPNISNESIQTIGFTTFSTLTHTKYLRKHTSTISFATFTILSHNLNTYSFNTTFFHTTQNTPKMENYTAHIVHQIYCSHAKHFDNISTYPTDKSTHLNNISDEQYLSQHINDMSQPVRTIKCIASIRMDEFYFIKIKYS